MTLQFIFGIFISFICLLYATEDSEITLQIENYQTAENELLQEKKRLQSLNKELDKVANTLQKHKSFYQQELIAKLDHAISQYEQKLEETEKELTLLEEELTEQEMIRKQILSEMKRTDKDHHELSDELRTQQQTTEIILGKQRELFQKKTSLQKKLEEAQVTHNRLKSTHWSKTDRYEDLSKKKKSFAQGLFATGEYLYLQVWQDDLDVAGRGATFPGEILDAEFDWTSSFRVGLGYQINRDWKSLLTYFCYSPEGKRRIEGGSNTMDPLFYTRISSFSAQGIQLSPIQSVVTIDNLDNVDSAVSLKLQSLDWSLSRRILCYKWLFLDGELGVQGAYARERLNNNYQGRTRISIAESGEPLTTFFFDYTIHAQDRWRFIGGGIFLGGEGTIPLCNNFSFMTHGKGSLLFGKYHNRYLYTTVQGSAGNAAVVNFEELFRDFRTIDGNEDFTGMNFLFSLRTGFSWEHMVAKSSSFSLHIFYEAMLWMDLSRYRRGLQGRSFFIDPTPTIQFSTAEGMTSAIDPNHVAIHGAAISGSITF